MSFTTNCKYTCWECSRQCQMKEAMETLTDNEFKAYALSNVKMQAGMHISAGCMNAQTSKRYVEIMFMSVVCARQKYLKTLNN